MLSVVNQVPSFFLHDSHKSLTFAAEISIDGVSAAFLLWMSVSGQKLSTAPNTR